MVEFIIGHGERDNRGEIGLTPRAKKIVELAVDEARRLGDKQISTEHLLLGLVREGEGIGAGVLESIGITLERVRFVVNNNRAPAPSIPTAKTKAQLDDEIFETETRLIELRQERKERFGE